MNAWRLISSAPHIPLATTSGGQVGWREVDGCGGAEVAGVDTLWDDAEEDGIPSPGEVGVWWCEVSAVAMPALAPATTTTLAAASTGAQPRPRPHPRPRRGRGSRDPPRARPASLASRNATSSTVTLRGGSGVTWCSISASCRSSVFTTPHLRS